MSGEEKSLVVSSFIYLFLWREQDWMRLWAAREVSFPSLVPRLRCLTTKVPELTVSCFLHRMGFCLAVLVTSCTEKQNSRLH